LSGTIFAFGKTAFTIGIRADQVCRSCPSSASARPRRKVQPDPGF
jgi:hypothetical protein